MKFRIDGTLRENQQRSTGSDTEISRYIKALDSLKEGEGVVAKLIACGHSAIEPLQQFLLTGEPGVVYHTRRWAVEALRKIGPPAASDLIQAAINPYPNRESEDPSSLLGRRSAVGLLAEIGITKGRWKLLRLLLDEVDGEILVAVFRIAGEVAGMKDRTMACRRLIEVLQNADWYAKGEIENALIDRFEMVKKTIEEEISRHRQRSQEEWDLDPVLTTLLNVKHKAEQGK